MARHSASNLAKRRVDGVRHIDRVFGEASAALGSRSIERHAHGRAASTGLALRTESA